MKPVKIGMAATVGVAGWLALTSGIPAQTAVDHLLVLSKSTQTLAIIDPVTYKVEARIPAGPDPHEVIASSDGRTAYISNYGGPGSDLHTLSVVDLVRHRALPAINIAPLHSAHGLAFSGGKLYFTAETNKVIGRYDPATRQVDWVMGTGQDRTHMIEVAADHEHIFTSNVASGTISIMEEALQAGFGPPPGGPGQPPGPPGGPGQPPGPRPGPPRKVWTVTSIPSGNGSEGFDVAPDGREIWAANARDATVTVIDVASKKATQTFAIPSHNANRLRFTLDGKEVLISGLGSGPQKATTPAPDLVVVDAKSHQVVKEISLGGGSAGILMAPDGHRAFVAVSGSDHVAVLDLATLTVAGQVTVDRQPDGMAWSTNGGQ